MTLKNQISSLAETFAAGVLAAIRSSSLEEILAGGGSASARTPSAAPGKRGPGRPRKDASNGAAPVAASAAPKAKAGKGGRLARRSPSDIEHVIGVIVSALSQAPEGLRSEHLQRVLKLDKKEITGPLSQALASKKITKKGKKRSTTYFAK
jgi:hypothetical protein